VPSEVHGRVPVEPVATCGSHVTTSTLGRCRLKTLVALLAVTGLTFAPLMRETNSRAAASRAMKAYAKRDYPGAVKDFQAAGRIAPSPLRDFDLGTAQIAAGLHEAGSATVTRAMRDPSLREPALLNRGNAALASKAYDYAIRDYAAALRLQPGDAAAKRNLEIALQKKAQQEQQKNSDAAAGKQNPAPQPPQPSPAQRDGKPQPRGNTDRDALLRSVQQQEQEELARMRAQRAVKGHVGW
jgi:tetratricopeptide (TPR) repeat protein